MMPARKTENFFENNIVVTNYSSENVMIREVLANQKLVYKLIESDYEMEDTIANCYGIEIECYLFGERETSKVLNITSKIEIAKELFDLLCANLVTPISLKEIVEDFITEKYSYN